MRTKSESRRQAIVAAATEVFIERGYEAASMGEITARAGGSKATLYSYFPSKEDLFLAVLKSQGGGSVKRALTGLTHGDDLAATLQAFGEDLLAGALNPEMVALRAIVFGEARRSGFGKQFYENGPRQAWTELAAFLEAEMAAGRLRPARPWTAAMHLVGLLQAEHQELMILGGDAPAAPSQISATVQDAVRVFLGGYAPTAPASQPDKAAPPTGLHGDS